MPTGTGTATTVKPSTVKVKRATYESLRDKKRMEKELDLQLDGTESSFLLRSISAKDYDKLLTSCPPNVEQRASGAIYNINTFAPVLLSRVIVEPEMTEEQWVELWVSPDWNRGELMTFFSEAVELCNTGLSLGPTGQG
jgi:hypothetical protein